MSDGVIIIGLAGIPALALAIILAQLRFAKMPFILLSCSLIALSGIICQQDIIVFFQIYIKAEKNHAM